MQQFKYKQRVPAEYMGMGRVFRNRVDAASDEFKSKLLTLSKPLVRRFDSGKATLRPEQQRDAQRLWESMGLPYRFSFTAYKDENKCLAIEEVRLDSVELRFESWLTFEPGVGISRMVLTTNQRYWFEGTPFVIVSLHALARWMERSRQHDEASLLRDLSLLIDHADPYSEQTSTPTGYWLGESRVLAGGHGNAQRSFDVRCVRTFIDSDEPLPLVQPRTQSMTLAAPREHVFVNSPDDC
jgi:hypothetical protein